MRNLYGKGVAANDRRRRNGDRVVVRFPDQVVDSSVASRVLRISEPESPPVTIVEMSNEIHFSDEPDERVGSRATVPHRYRDRSKEYIVVEEASRKLVHR